MHNNSRKAFIKALCSYKYILFVKYLNILETNKEIKTVKLLRISNIS